MLAVVVGVAAVALDLFQPWKLWVDQTVNEMADWTKRHDHDKETPAKPATVENTINQKTSS